MQQCQKSYESPTNNLCVVREHWFATRNINMAGRGLVSREKAGFSEYTCFPHSATPEFDNIAHAQESGQMIEIGIYFNTTLDSGLSGRILELDHP